MLLRTWSGGLDGQNAWTAGVESKVASDSADGRHPLLQCTAAPQDAAYRALAENAVPDGESATLFARFRSDQTGNANFGFSELAVPAAYNDFEAQINRRNGTVLSACDGTGFQDFDPIVDGVDVQYKRWLVADNELHTHQPRPTGAWGLRGGKAIQACDERDALP